MKKIFMPSLFLLSSSLCAEVTFNAAMTTDYNSRGVSGSDRGPAIQGGVDYQSDNGIIAGIFTSTISGADSTGQEINLYAGYEKEILPELIASAQIIQYEFLKDSSLNYVEGELGLTYKFLTLRVAYAPKTPADATTDYQNIYTNLSLQHELAKDLSVSLSGGHSYFDKKVIAESKNYFDALVSLTKTSGNLAISLNYADTFGRKTYDADSEVWNKETKDESLFVSASIAF